MPFSRKRIKYSNQSYYQTPTRLLPRHRKVPDIIKRRPAELQYITPKRTRYEGTIPLPRRKQILSRTAKILRRLAEAEKYNKKEARNLSQEMIDEMADYDDFYANMDVEPIGRFQHPFGPRGHVTGGAHFKEFMLGKRPKFYRMKGFRY